jgi:hypothetical protein
MHIDSRLRGERGRPSLLSENTIIIFAADPEHIHTSEVAAASPQPHLYARVMHSLHLYDTSRPAPASVATCSACQEQFA